MLILFTADVLCSYTYINVISNGFTIIVIMV